MSSTLSGKVAAFKQLEVVANNLANMNTTGFKAERLQFQKELNSQVASFFPGFESDVAEPGQFAATESVRIKGSYTDFSHGNLEVTNSPTDLAVDGEGFFVVQTPAGERYTRAGSFQVDSDGRLVTNSGHPVQGTAGEILINGSNIEIGPAGTIRVNGQSIGQIRLVNFNPEDVTREAGQLFQLKDGAVPEEVIDVKVKSGVLEASNVNAVRELVDMISASRLYDTFQKVSQSEGQMNRLRNEQIGNTEG